jgi:hypothetical protein
MDHFHLCPVLRSLAVVRLHFGCSDVLSVEIACNFNNQHRYPIPELKTRLTTKPASVIRILIGSLSVLIS